MDLIQLWHAACAYIESCFPPGALHSIQSLMWAPISSNPEAAWGIIAIVAAIGAAFQLRMVLNSQVDALGFARVMIFVGQAAAVGIPFQSGWTWYALFFYGSGNALASILLRVDWCHQRGSFWERVGKSYYVLRHFDQVHPLVTGHIGAHGD